MKQVKIILLIICLSVTVLASCPLYAVSQTQTPSQSQSTEPKPPLNGFLAVPWGSDEATADKIVLARPNTKFITRVVLQDSPNYMDVVVRYLGTFGNQQAIIDLEFTGTKDSEKFMDGTAFIPADEDNILKLFVNISQALRAKYGVPSVSDEYKLQEMKAKWYLSSNGIPACILMTIKSSSNYANIFDIPDSFKKVSAGVAVEYQYNDIFAQQIKDINNSDL